MRIVVSGTHASGKSTLIGDFSAAHPEYEVLPDPYELVDEAGDEPDAALFLAQFGISARRLLEFERGARVIAERGPLDFLAYLTALDELGRPSRAAGHDARAVGLTIAAMSHVDLLVVVPLSRGIRVPEDEDPQLREAMDDALLELSDDLDLLADARVIEVTGDPADRLAQLEAAIADLDRP